jgi:hypothetical protein
LPPVSSIVAGEYHQEHAAMRRDALPNVVHDPAVSPSCQRKPC